MEEGAGAPDVVPKPIARFSSVGLSPDLLALSEWAAWRWAGPRQSFLGTASPPTNVSPAQVRVEGVSRAPIARKQPSVGWAGAAFGHSRSVLRLAPATDPWPVVVEAAARGAALVLVPSVARARRLSGRLREAGVAVALAPDEWAAAAGGGRVVVGARAAAWAPCPDLAAVVVIDAHDEVYEEERAPTWNAWRVAAERAARAGVPCVLVSSCPSLEHLAWGELVSTTRDEERNGWSLLEVVDRREDDPRTGLWSERLVAAARAAERVVCVLNRKGRARRLACVACGEMAACTRCGAAVSQDEPGTLVCHRCSEARPVVCAQCGGAKLKSLRLGTAKAVEELAALVGRPVGEVTATTDVTPSTDVLVGTEAVLHRVGRADLVAFVDFDAELSAPHYRAGEAALSVAGACVASHPRPRRWWTRPGADAPARAPRSRRGAHRRPGTTRLLRGGGAAPPRLSAVQRPCVAVRRGRHRIHAHAADQAGNHGQRTRSRRQVAPASRRPRNPVRRIGRDSSASGPTPRRGRPAPSVKTIR